MSTFDEVLRMFRRWDAFPSWASVAYINKRTGLLHVKPADSVINLVRLQELAAVFYTWDVNIDVQYDWDDRACLEAVVPLSVLPPGWRTS